MSITCVWGLYDMDAMREDKPVVEVTDEDVDGRTKWKWEIH